MGLEQFCPRRNGRIDVVFERRTFLLCYAQERVCHEMTPRYALNLACVADGHLTGNIKIEESPQGGKTREAGRARGGNTVCKVSYSISYARPLVDGN